MAATKELRQLEITVPDLLKHKLWAETQRGYLKETEKKLQSHEIIWQLDYGGFTDSENKKVGLWSFTVISGGSRKPGNFDFFF